MKVYKVGFFCNRMRGLRFLVALFLLVLAIDFVSAQTCNPNQIIFKISDITNAHAEEWNGTAYTKELCFNHFFEGDFAGSSPHDSDASGSNKVVGLSSSTNAHLESPNESNYGVGVFYGDLECRIETLARCDFTLKGHESTRIGSLSSLTNAHFDRGINYGFYLCCASASHDPNVDPSACGNGIVDVGEECDGGNSGKVCSDVLGSDYGGGDLKCYDSGDWQGRGCTWNTEFCYDTTSMICKDFEKLLPVVPVNNCGDINDINQANLTAEGITPEGTLEEYKESVCNSCYQWIGRNVCNEAGDSGECLSGSPRCVWDASLSGGAGCRLEYSLLGGVCEISRVEGSESECSPGDSFKTVNYTDSCDPSCQFPNGCPRQIPCPRVVQLPFFDKTGFIATILIIGLIYLSYIIIEKKK